MTWNLSHKSPNRSVGWSIWECLSNPGNGEMCWYKDRYMIWGKRESSNVPFNASRECFSRLKTPGWCCLFMNFKIVGWWGGVRCHALWLQHGLHEFSASQPSSIHEYGNRKEIRQLVISLEKSTSSLSQFLLPFQRWRSLPNSAKTQLLIYINSNYLLDLYILLKSFNRAY